MKIAVFIPTIKAGGAEKQAALLAVSLSAMHEVYLVSFYGLREASPSVRTMLENGNVNVVFLEGGFFKRIKAYYSLLKKSGIDACFNYLTMCDVVGSIVEKIAGVGKVYNGIRNSKLALPKLIAEWFAHNLVADYTVYNCYSGARYFESIGYSKKKTVIIPNCFMDISEPIDHQKREKKRVITVARFQPQKDYETAIHTMAELRKWHDDFEFIIIGHGSLETDVRQWIKDYGIEDITTVYVAPDNVQELLKDSDVYLSTSLFEGTSNSIMEAMNWSVPVVATNVGDNDRLVIDGLNGFLAPVGDYQTLAVNISKLLNDDGMRREMGIHGNERLHDYSVERFVESYSKLLEA